MDATGNWAISVDTVLFMSTWSLRTWDESSELEKDFGSVACYSGLSHSCLDTKKNHSGCTLTLCTCVLVCWKQCWYRYVQISNQCFKTWPAFPQWASVFTSPNESSSRRWSCFGFQDMELSKVMGVPPKNHPFLFGIFDYKPSITWGSPMT